MRARVLAIVAAVLLIAGAVLVRSAITGGDDDQCVDGAQDCGDDGGADDDAGPPRVACTPDLDAVCAALADDGAITEVEPVDLDDAADRAEDLDGWLTHGAAPTLIGYDVPPNDPDRGPYVRPAPIASARLAAVVPPGSTEPVGGACLQKPTWRCLDAAVRSGDVPLAVGDSKPMSAAAITNLAPLAGAGRYGVPDVDAVEAFARVAPAYASALKAGAAPTATVARQLDTVVTRSGVADVVVAPNALAQNAVRQADSRSGTTLRSLAAAPTASDVVVLAATRAGDVGNDVEKALIAAGAPADALERLGYRIDPDARLPSEQQAGFLYQVWKALDR